MPVVIGTVDMQTSKARSPFICFVLFLLQSGWLWRSSASGQKFPPEPLCRSALRRLLFSFLHVSVFYVSYSAASEAVIDSEAEVPSNLAVSSTTSLCFVSISVSHLARFLPLQRRWRRR